jgi:hypothetical protein
MIGAMGFLCAQRIMMLLTATFSELNQRQMSSAADLASTKDQLVFENERFSRSRMRPILKRCGGDGRRRKRNGIVMLIKWVCSLINTAAFQVTPRQTRASSIRDISILCALDAISKKAVRSPLPQHGSTGAREREKEHAWQL